MGVRGALVPSVDLLGGHPFLVSAWAPAAGDKVLGLSAGLIDPPGSQHGGHLVSLPPCWGVRVVAELGSGELPGCGQGTNHTCRTAGVCSAPPASVSSGHDK